MQVLMVLLVGQLVRPPLDPSKFGLGQMGPFPTNYAFRVEKILSKTEAIVLPRRDEIIENINGKAFVTPAKVGKPFILEGLDTSGWADGKKIDPRGFYKVAATRKLDSATYYVLKRTD